jgi:hypothetical protein
MCEAPSTVPERQLADLGIGLRPQAARAVKKGAEGNAESQPG